MSSVTWVFLSGLVATRTAAVLGMMRQPKAGLLTIGLFRLGKISEII